jgi:hypothetical protein
VLAVHGSRKGGLIGLALAEDVVFNLTRSMRDAWPAWPSKVAPLIAAELGAGTDAVAMLLAEYVYHQLGEPQPDFTSC